MRVLPTLLLVTAAALPAKAEIVKYEFTATVATVVELAAGATTGQFVDASSIAGPTLSVGDTWTGYLFYDTGLQLTPWQPQQPPGAVLNSYTGYLASAIIDQETGLAFQSTLDGISTPTMYVADSSVDIYADSVTIITYAYDGGQESGGFFFGADRGTFSDAAPPAGLDLADLAFASVSYTFTGAGGDNVNALATITSLVPTDALPPVPEPASYGMLGLGLGILAFLSRRERSA